MNDSDSTVEIRYEPTRCQLLKQDVWAVVARQADETWRIVNCLDKHTGCYGLECAFTTDCGAWPYEIPPEAEHPSS